MEIRVTGGKAEWSFADEAAVAGVVLTGRVEVEAASCSYSHPVREERPSTLGFVSWALSPQAANMWSRMRLPSLSNSVRTVPRSSAKAQCTSSSKRSPSVRLWQPSRGSKGRVVPPSRYGDVKRYRLRGPGGVNPRRSCRVPMAGLCWGYQSGARSPLYPVPHAAWLLCVPERSGVCVLHVGRAMRPGDSVRGRAEVACESAIHRREVGGGWVRTVYYRRRGKRPWQFARRDAQRQAVAHP